MPSFLDKLKNKQQETYDRPPGTPKDGDDATSDGTQSHSKVLDTVTTLVTTKRKLRKKVIILLSVPRSPSLSISAFPLAKITSVAFSTAWDRSVATI